MNTYKCGGHSKPAVISVTAVFIIAYLLVSHLIVKLPAAMHSSCRIYAAENKTENIKHVLYVNSYHPGYRWSDRVQSGIMDTLINEYGRGIDIRVEYLDAKRYPPQLEGTLADDIAVLLKRKYQKIKFDFIIVSDQDGYNLLKKIRGRFFPGVPLIFCGVEEPGVIDKNTTGILAGTDYRANIDLILKVLPETGRIWIITDRSATGEANRKHIEMIAADLQERVKLSFFDSGSGLEPEEVFSAAEMLKPRDVIFFLDFYNTRSGAYVDTEAFIRELTDRSAAPVFSHVDIYLDYGVTGGMMNSGLIQGRQAAETGIRILRGVKAESIPPVPEKSLPSFNFIKLEQYGIPESALPAESRIINRRESFIHYYLWYLLGGTVLITLELILIIWLFRLLKKHRQLRKESLEKEKAVRQSEADLKVWMDRYNFIVAASGHVVYEYVISTGDITWGSSIETVLGYTPEQMKDGFSRWKDLLHPDDLQATLSTLGEAEKNCAFWEARYRMRHSLGHYVWIRDRGFFIPDDTGKARSQLGLMEDITALKQAEEAMDFERRQLLSIFDSIDEMIYVSDPITYEILFANRRLREQFGKDPIGGLCYKELQGFDEPCSFCTNQIILEKKGIPYKWEYFNPLQRQTVSIVDRIIRWPDGRDVRFEIAVDITEQKRAEEALKESEERTRALLNALPDMIFVFNSEGVFTDFRALDKDELLMPPGSFIGKSVFEVLSQELAELTSRNIDNVLKTGNMSVYQYSLSPGDSTRYYESRMVLKSSDEVLCIVRDITGSIESEEERERLQAQLVQAQKIESVGRLAGGIAHDFNNMLGAITGYSELALRKMDPDNPLRRYLDEILRTAGRSADLTRQLLAFARQQVIEPKIVNLNDTVESMLAMLRRLIGENINLVWKPCGDLWMIHVDPAQMDQVLANLSLNARDAIGEAGTISIETMNTVIDEAYSSGTDNIQPGDYVILTVSDTGSGMDRATRERIFEPFFTTKELGHGTGLGLATVYGIVKQNKGFINVYSEPGKGSSFRIYFPGLRREGGSKEIQKTEVIPYGRGEMILLAEDEPALMDITKSLLEELNYTVIAAGSPAEAISLSEKYSGKIDLLITDIIMPQMNGRDLAVEIEAERPGMKTLFMSGYTADVIARQGVIDEGISFIQKPFSMLDIAVKIRSVLEKD